MKRIKTGWNKKVQVAGNEKRSKAWLASTFFVGVVLTLWLLPGHAMATKERYVLEFGDSHIHGHRGEGAILFLKRTLKEQYPWVNISDLVLRKVVLMAKTKKGKGKAQLRVGPEVSDLYRINGHPRAFRDEHRASYDRVRIGNPSYDSGGPWQILLRGNFKVRKVVLVVDKRDLNRRYGFHRDWDRYGWHHWRRSR